MGADKIGDREGCRGMPRPDLFEQKRYVIPHVPARLQKKRNEQYLLRSGGKTTDNGFVRARLLVLKKSVFHGGMFAPFPQFTGQAPQHGVRASAPAPMPQNDYRRSHENPCAYR